MKIQKKPKQIKYFKPKDLLKTVKAKKRKKMNPILQMLVVIVNRGKGDDVTAFLKQSGINSRICSFGEGTATSSLQNILGLSNNEKEIISCIIPIENSTKFLDKLEEEFLTVEKYAGIAFTIPLKSITKGSFENLV